MTTNTATAEATTETAPSVTDATVFIEVSFETLGNRRSVKLDPNTDAERDWLSHQKDLLHSSELRAVRAYKDSVASWMESQSFKTTIARSGMYLVPVLAVERIMDELERRKTEWSTLVDVFCDHYANGYVDAGGESKPSLVEQARERLGSLFNAGDYVNDPRSAFSFETRIVALETPSTLRQISEALWKKEQDKAAASWSTAADEIREGLRAGLLEVVNRLKTAMEPDTDGKRKTIRQPAVDALKEFLALFDERNVVQDDEIRLLALKAKTLAAGVPDAKTLREDGDLQERVRKSLAEIGGSLAGMATAKKRDIDLDGE